MKRLLIYLVIVMSFVSTTLSANTSSIPVNTNDIAKQAKSASLQIPFVKNVGQVNDNVKFYTDTYGGTFLVKANGELVLAIPPANNTNENASLISEVLIDSDIKSITGTLPAVTKVGYFLGSKKENWRNNIPTYKLVSLGDIYDNIELSLQASNDNVEKLFHIRPGGDPDKIRLQVSGAEKISHTEDGLLALQTKQGAIYYSRPKAYQVVANEIREVDVAYFVKDNAYGFKLGDYDKSKELVIDPLLQSTYFGGANNDLIRDVAISPSGDIYAAGQTNSIISGVAGLPLYTRDSYDAFVARFNSSLTELLYVGFIGSKPTLYSGGTDVATSIAFRSIDGGDFEVYIGGYTSSTDLAGVEAGVSADDIYIGSGGEEEGFVARFSSDLKTLHRTTYYGGSTIEAGAPGGTYPNDRITSIDIQSVLQADGTTYRDEVFITGKTTATNIPGRTSTPPDLNPTVQYLYGGGESDAFLARLNYELTDIVEATYIGGSGMDEARHLFVDGLVHIAGNTDSTDFPGIQADSFQQSLAGGQDAFIIIMNTDNIYRSTYIGGSGDETLQSMASTYGNTSGYYYIVGNTDSTDFPEVADGGMPVPNDGFIARLQKTLANDAGSTYQATYIGGNGADQLWDVEYYPDSNTLYVTGSTQSSDFPGSTGAVQEALVGTQDAFVLKINSFWLDFDGSYQMTYLGGSSSPEEAGFAIDVDTVNGVYVAGVTTAPDFPGTAGGAQSFHGGGYQDGFIARLDSTLATTQNPEIRVSPDSLDFADVTVGSTSAKTLTIINEGVDNLTISGIVLSDLVNYQLDTTSTASSCDNLGGVVQPGNNCVVTVTFAPTVASAPDPVNATVTISSNDADEATVVVTLTGTGGTDSDGVPDSEEMGPSGTDLNYDGNGDGVADREQANVASLHSFDNSHYVTIAAETGLALENVVASDNPSPVTPPTSASYPYGFFSFVITGLNAGDVATVTITLPAGETPDVYWKYGPQPPSVAASWYRFDFDGARGAEFNGNVITLHFTDGRWGDHDLVANGRIEDPGAPAVTVVAPSSGGGSSGLFMLHPLYLLFMLIYIVFVSSYLRKKA